MYVSMFLSVVYTIKLNYHVNQDDDGSSIPNKKSKTSSAAPASAKALLSDDVMLTHWKKNTVSKVC